MKINKFLKGLTFAILILYPTTSFAVSKPMLNLQVKDQYVVGETINLTTSISNPYKIKKYIKFGYEIYDNKNKKILSREEVKPRLMEGAKTTFPIKGLKEGVYTVKTYYKIGNKVYGTSSKKIKIVKSIPKKVIEKKTIEKVTIELIKYGSPNKEVVTLSAVNQAPNTFVFNLRKEDPTTSINKIKLLAGKNETLNLAFKNPFGLEQKLNFSLTEGKETVIEFPDDIFGFDNPPEGASINTIKSVLSEYDNNIQFNFKDSKGNQYKVIIQL